MATSSDSKPSLMGPALTSVILLRDWDRYGLAERVCYHFDLAEALAASERERGDPNNTNQQAGNLAVCGVSCILECIPASQQQLSKRTRKALRTSLVRFNSMAARVMEEQKFYCHEPPHLPLRLNPASRVFFAYETVRIAFCLDASPTLTSTFGFGSGKACCPLDRLVEMARTFFSALVQPISVPSRAGVWKPELAVSVLAVYPDADQPEISLLVRDFRVTDLGSAETLSKMMQTWALGEVEARIARRFAYSKRRHNYDAWNLPSQASYLRHILTAGDTSLGILSSVARPCIVIATDGCCLECDRIADISPDQEDVPVSVLDLSNPASHASHDVPAVESFDLLSSDPDGSTMPLYLSDDTEDLHNICIATGGAFWDSQLLEEAAETFAGQVATESPLWSDHFFSSARHSIKPNAVQWYTLFSLSPLSPRQSSTWGQLPPPSYIREKRLKRSEPTSKGPKGRDHLGAPEYRKASQIRTILSTYIINPIPIKGLLMMRVKEGYRAKQYGQNTNDPAKVSMQFTLPLEVGVVLHYELSYKALSEHNHRIGFAHVKIELSGDPSLIHMVKTDFIHGSQGRPSSVHQKASDRICELLRWMRKEDMLQSYLTPVKWSDQLKQRDTPFVRRLGSLSEAQQHRHFRFDEFDCVCVGRMPYQHDDNDFLSQFRDTDDGSKELIDIIADWSSQTIKERKRFVKETKTGKHDLPAYCIVEVWQSRGVSRLWTITIETLGGSRASDRLSILSSLRKLINSAQNVVTLQKQMGRFLAGMEDKDPYQASRNAMIGEHHDHEQWDLVMDPELLPLLMKRRIEIGRFFLLDSGDDHALFAKIVRAEKRKEPGTLFQYRLRMTENRVVVDFSIEKEAGIFSLTQQAAKSKTSRFHHMARILRRRDQECGLALQSRTVLLKAFDSGEQKTNQSQLSCAQRLMEYSSLSTTKLRFFHRRSVGANDQLWSLTEDMFMSKTLGPRIAKLSFQEGGKLGGKVSGDWFLVEFDKHAISFVHIGHSLETEVSKDHGLEMTYAEMSLFTVGIGDLYSRRDDVADDILSDDDHISEHLCVTEFTDLVQDLHKRNYASAAYLAAIDTDTNKFSLQSDDFSEVMEQLDFVDIAHVLIPGERPEETETNSRLVELLESIVSALEGDDFCFAFRKRSQTEIRFDLDDGSSISDSFETDSRETYEKVDDEMSAVPGQTVSGIETLLTEEEGSLNDGSGLLIANFHPDDVRKVPIFLRFLLDREPASMDDLRHVGHSTNLTVLVSVYVGSSRSNSPLLEGRFPSLPVSHLNVAAEIGSLLDAYVAEETLERLRRHGSGIEDEDLQMARTCLRKARYAMASTIDVFFYVPKSDSMVSAGAPAGANLEVEEGFQILSDQLLQNGKDALKSFGDGDAFFVADSRLEGNVLSFFCFVRLRKIRGTIAVEVYHPDGSEHASDVLERIHQTISLCCHRTNQILLLRRLHGSRMASDLLMLPDSDRSATRQEDVEVAESNPFYPGVFACPVQFRTTFDLFHRCATNPAQVALTIEATVLHIFSISNRRRVFVYKDEDGSVFYMRLSTSGGGLEPDGRIELLVFGVDNPGPSVTQQLRSLLQKRLHHIAVDMLSSVLTKNPRYVWKAADVEFVNSFETELGTLEGTNVSQESSYVRFYPMKMEPTMMLLYFRQNIYGSTFFHPLATPETAESKALATNFQGTPSLNLRFYYNNATSKLDPTFQAQCTLTKKGAEYSRQAGTGVGIVEVSLVDDRGEQLPEIPTTLDKPEIENSADLSVELLKGVPTLMNRDSDRKKEGGTFLKVVVTGAALKCDVLHDWIKLTLDQSLTAWNIECLLDRQKKGMCPHPKANTCIGHKTSSKEETIDELCPRLPELVSLLESASNLPHPAVLKFQYEGVVRSSVVADFALDLLEGAIIEHIRAEDKRAFTAVDSRSNLTVIRLSRNTKPRRALLFREKKTGKAAVSIICDKKRTVIRDAPIDCPEYLIFYSIPPDTEKHPHRLFEEVLLDDGTNAGVADELATLRKEKPLLFHRRFAFVLSVKRNKRTILAYNWSTKLFNNTIGRIQDKETQILISTRESVGSLQRRSLRMLSPFTDGREQESCRTSMRTHQYTADSIPDLRASDSIPSIPERSDTNRSTTRRRLIGRPTNIRRPKLVGKSMEGAAAHAVAASRARASSNMFKNVPSTVSTGGPTRKHVHANRKGVPPLAKPPGVVPLVGGRQVMPSMTARGNKEVMSLRKYYEMILGVGQSRFHNEHIVASQASTYSVWPLKSRRDIPLPVAEAVLQEGGLLQTDFSELLPLPPIQAKTFVAALANKLVSWNPKLSIVPIREQKETASSFMLSGQIRAVRYCKCVVIMRISIVQVKHRSRCTFLSLESFLLTLPRREKDKKPASKGRRYHSCELGERDAMGTDLLSFSTNQIVRLNRVLFDHAASIVEGAIKTAGGDVDYGWVLNLFEVLVDRYTFAQQRKTLRSAYKCFRAPIVLKSFGDSFISKYDGPTLFSWLKNNLKGRTLMLCGPSGLFLKREVIVQGTRSTCVLTMDVSSPERMYLVVLCRSADKDLHEFMFRDGSNMAISIVDNIAVECAQLAFEELHQAARLLDRDRLWGLVSSSKSTSPPSSQQLDDLLRLCTIKAASEYMKASDSQQFDLVCNSDDTAKRSRFFSSLASEQAFSPSWRLGQDKRIAYCRSEDVFFLVDVKPSSRGMRIDIVLRDNALLRNKAVFALQKLLNCVLFSFWQEMEDP